MSERLKNLPHLGYLRGGQAKIQMKRIQTLKLTLTRLASCRAAAPQRGNGTGHLGGLPSLLLRVHFNECLYFYCKSSDKQHFSWRTQA